MNAKFGHFNIIYNYNSAVATSTIEPGIEHIGLGWMFTTLGLILITNTAFIPILIKYGPGWWAKRTEKQQLQAQKRRAERDVERDVHQPNEREEASR